MSGIVGVITSSPNDKLAGWLDRMILPMQRKEWYNVERKLTTNAALASLSLGASWMAEDHATILTISGEICDQDKLAAQLKAAGEPCATNGTLSELLLRLYHQFGVRSLCNLNGIYTLSIWEKEARRLTIVTDRYGFKKLYYWLTDGQFCFASEYKSICQHPAFQKKIDEVALADFLSVDYCLADRTFFANVKLIGPATILTYEQGCLTEEQYWDYQFATANAPVLSKDEYIDGYFFHLKNAVEKRVHDNLCLQLTGGLDSRCLAALLREFADPAQIKTVTAGQLSSQEVQLAQRIAATLGYTHTALPIHADWLTRYAEAAVWRLEGTVNCFTSWILAFDDFIETNKIKFAMNGFLGGSLAGSRLPPKLTETSDSDTIASSIYQQAYQVVFQEPELATFLKPHIYQNVKGESLKTIKAYLARATADDLLNKAFYVELHQRQRRFTAAHIDGLAEICEVADPFADNDFVDFVLQIPPHMKKGKQIYKEMIVKHLPAVAQIPYAKTGLSLTASKNDMMFAEVKAKWQKRIYRDLLPRLTAGRWRYIDTSIPFQFDNWLRSDSKDTMTALLQNKMYLEDFFNMDRIEQLVVDHVAGKRNDYRMICALITFALWRKQFCS